MQYAVDFLPEMECYGISFKQTELRFGLLGCHFLIIHPIIINSKMKISHLSIIKKMITTTFVIILKI